MRPPPDVLPAPVPVTPGPPPHCQACGTTVGPLERTVVPTAGGPTRVERCVDPVQCELRARIDGTWCTYDPTA